MSEQLRAELAKMQAVFEAQKVPTLHDRATVELAAVLDAALVLARARNHPLIAEHFVLAALADPRGTAILEMCGADLGRTRRELEDFLDSPAIPDGWSLHWDLIVVHARVLGLGRLPKPHPLHVGHLLVCLRQVRGFITGLLAAQGVTLLRLREATAHGSISFDGAAAIPKATVVGGGGAGTGRGAYEIVLHDDDFTKVEVVNEILGKVFKKTPDQCAILVTIVTRNGSGAIATGTLRDVLPKVEKATRLAREAEYPLKLTLRPVT